MSAEGSSDREPTAASLSEWGRTETGTDVVESARPSLDVDGVS